MAGNDSKTEYGFSFYNKRLFINKRKCKENCTILLHKMRIFFFMISGFYIRLRYLYNDFLKSGKGAFHCSCLWFD